MGGERVRIYEVGPRDGLQNESAIIPTETKAAFIGLLADAGLREIEATSFVSPRAIPQLADAEALLESGQTDGPVFATRSSCPNVRGLDPRRGGRRGRHRRVHGGDRRASPRPTSG